MGHYFLVLENRSDLDARILFLSLPPFRVGGERHRRSALFFPELGGIFFEIAKKLIK